MRAAALSLLLLVVPLAPAAQAPPAESGSDTLEEVLVTGEQPGPGLWQVIHGDNTLWILGTYTPLPAKMQWRSRTVEALIAESQSVIAPPDVSTNIGLFSGLRLVPSLLRARAIPDGGTLDQVLGAEVYARWAVQKDIYLRGHDKVERWRPAFAGALLYGQALRASKLNAMDVVWPVVERAAKRADVPVRTPAVQLDIEEPRELIKDYGKSALDAEVACFETLLLRVERDLPLLRERANAWAVGNVERLRRLPAEDPEERCLEIVTSSPRLEREFQEALQKVRQEWLLAVEGALLRNRSTVAVVPIRELFNAGGLLAQLRRLGYRIEEP